ncbi:DUF4097 family beta strand repeat-containing protein [Clostridium akagii]|uniref:DUF4097 family beta strand repeat-containing protein n=1 Tax=Clostridium akagii TaxID=91623 RepID=UPI00047D3154|nr:DUF4097 family beta strand repeat-containing protein [Clostridium akagii]
MNSLKKFNVKKVVIYLLGIMFVTLGLGTLIMLQTGTNLIKGTKPNHTVNDSKTSSLTGIDEIDVDVSSSDINIIPESTSQVKAHFYGGVTSGSSYKSPKIQCYKSGNTLVIKQVEPHMFFGFSNSNFKLDVYIPSGYNKNIKLVSSSGDININVNGYHFNKLDCNLSSGSLTINDLTADTFKYSSSSGDLKADKLTTKTTALDSSSGSININMFSGDLTSESSSGDCKIKYADFHNNIDVHSSSGEIELTLPKSAQFDLNAEASSGDVSCDFPVTVSGKNEHKLRGIVVNDKNKIKLDASSGDIKILN